MKWTTFWLIMAGLILIAYSLYHVRRSTSSNLDVEPHAAEEIEKAKRR